MSHNSSTVNGSRTVAPLANVGLATRAMELAMNRPLHLPGLVVFSGPSGYGKSMSAAFVANKFKAVYIECKSTWNRRAVLEEIAKRMRLPLDGTLYQLADAITGELALSGRPLIVDEMDYLVDKSAVEIIRDLYEGSKTAILLIGEEEMPGKLMKWDRFHGRVLEWVQAKPSDIADTGHLARLYCPGLVVEPDLVGKVHTISAGSARRICVMLEKIRQEALGQGLKSIGLKNLPSGFFDSFSGDGLGRSK